MSDTKPTTAEAASNPAEAVAQTETAAQPSVDKSSEENTAVADTTTDSKTTEASAGVKSEESSAKSDDKDKKEENGNDKKRSFDRKDDRNGKYDRNDRNDRGDKRRGGRHNDNSKFHKNKKPRNNEFDNLPETDDPVEIRSQVEFYFSVHNLSTDRHLFLEIEGANNRPVPVKHITSFKRMRRFQPYSAVVAALRDSESLILLDEGEYSGAGKEAIQRKEPLPVPTREGDEEKKPSLEELYDRMFRASQNKLDASVYVKGFGNLEEAGQIALEDFFKPYGAVMVRRRRDEDDNWKGSVFVEFDTEDSQQQFLALDPKPKFNGNELTIMGKKEYSEMKCKEKGIVPAWRQEPGAGEGNRSNWRDNRGGRGRGAGRGRGRGGDRGGRGRDRRDGDRRRDRSGSPDNKDWNGRRDKFQKSRDYNGRDKRDNKKTEDKDDSAKSVIRDADGVPIIQDTSKEPTKATTKRKAEDDDSAEKPKKSKIEFREDA